MPRHAVLFAIAISLCATALAQDETATPPEQNRSWFGRIFHRGSGPPNYSDSRLRGLILDLDLAPKPVKLGETRQLHLKALLTNRGKRPVTLEFPNAQRIEIQLLDAAENVLTKFSENHAFADVMGTVLINPNERVEYDETISTRELVPDKVYTCEVYFPEFPELRVRQKFLTAP